MIKILVEMFGFLFRLRRVNLSHIKESKNNVLVSSNSELIDYAYRRALEEIKANS